MKHPMPRGAAVLLALGLGFLASCGAIDIPSVWRSGAIAIDGRADDWTIPFSPIPDLGISAAVQNDADSVYVCLQILDPLLAAPIFSRGLTVWFDPAGGTNEKLGVRYPLGTYGQGLPNPYQDSIEERNRTAEKARMPGDFLEILGPEKGDMERFKRGQAKGVEAAVTSQGGVFVYEVKIPMAAAPDRPFAAASAPGRILGIGVSSPKSIIEKMGRGGYPGRSGRVGLTEDDMDPVERQAEELKLWLKTTLALPPKK